MLAANVHNSYFRMKLYTIPWNLEFRALSLFCLPQSKQSNSLEYRRKYQKLFILIITRLIHTLQHVFWSHSLSVRLLLVLLRCSDQCREHTNSINCATNLYCKNRPYFHEIKEESILHGSRLTPADDYRISRSRPWCWAKFKGQHRICE